MKNGSIRNKISVLSSDKNTIKLLATSLLASSDFLGEILPDTSSLESLLNSTADVLILDGKNPLKMSSIDICKIIRTKNDEVVILILADDFNVSTKVLALEFGADDYLKKPANQLEITARIKAILRRINIAEKSSLEEDEFMFNDLYLDARRRICTINGNELLLTNHEFSTLLYLVQSRGRPVSRAILLNNIWELPSDDPTRPVDDIVRRLRKKLKRHKSPTHISTIWGFGYRIEPE